MAEAVKVSVRIRPLNSRELAAGSACAVSVSGATVNVLGPTLRSFTYDQCFWSVDPNAIDFAAQEFVSRTVGNELVTQALNGFNGCVFAYGQTGSGKSYSVFGDKDAPGFIPWTVEKIFGEKRRLEDDGLKEVRVFLSYLEIYNEHLHDLLTANMHGRREDPDRDHLKIHDHPKLGVYVPGLWEGACEQARDVKKLLDYGAKKRAVASTQMNDASSRSHAVVILKVVLLTGQKPKDKSERDGRRELQSKLNLIDLAGSERQSRSHSEGDQFREACAINKSLSALGLVIKELSEEQNLSPKPRSRTIDFGPAGNPMLGGSNRARSFTAGGPANSFNTGFQTTHKVPFRASKLTFLLKDSLAGNSKTHMLAAISPAGDSIDETISTLRFASSVKEIKTVAIQNLHTRDGMIDSLKNELETLRAQLSADSNEKKDQVAEQERLIAEMMKGYEAQVEMANEMDRMREEALKDMALTHNDISSIFGVATMTPYLLNMSDDPTLAGRLLFYIPSGQKRDIGSAKDNAISLCGIGITERLCVVENTDNTCVTITKCGAEGRVIVAGAPLEQGRSIQLRHGQRIFLGRAFAMKVCIPADDLSEEVSPPLSPGLQDPGHDVNDLLLEGLEDEWASIEHSSSWCSLSDLLNHYSQQMPPDQASALWNEVKRAVMACDEANDITVECRPEEGLKFEVDLTSALRMSVVVRVLREGPDDQCQQLYIWSVGQMIERLDRMKDCYNTFKRTQEFSVDPLYDPWHEARSAMIWHRITELEKENYTNKLQINRLRGREQNLVSKTLLLMLDGIGTQALKVIFQSWAQVRKGKRRLTRVNLDEPIYTSDGYDYENEQGQSDELPAAALRDTPVTRSMEPAKSTRDHFATSQYADEEALRSENVFVDNPSRGKAYLEVTGQSSKEPKHRDDTTCEAVHRTSDDLTDPSLEDKLSLKHAFLDLRNELIEQRREAGRLRTNRTLLCNSIDRFEYGVERLLNTIEPSASSVSRSLDISSTTWEELLKRLEQLEQMTPVKDVPPRIPVRTDVPWPTYQAIYQHSPQQSPMIAQRPVLFQPPGIPAIALQTRPLPVYLSGMGYPPPQSTAPVVQLASPLPSSIQTLSAIPTSIQEPRSPRQPFRLVTPTSSQEPRSPRQPVRLLTPRPTQVASDGVPHIEHSNSGSHVFPARSFSQPVLPRLPLETLNATVNVSPTWVPKGLSPAPSPALSPRGSPAMPSSPRLSGVNSVQVGIQRAVSLPFSTLAKNALGTKSPETIVQLGSTNALGSANASPRNTLMRQMSANCPLAHRRSQTQLNARAGENTSAPIELIEQKRQR